MTHRYMDSVPGCWGMYCEVLEKEYSDIRYARAHHFTVDAYACQHPGKPGIVQAIKSVGIHLAFLYMLFEKRMELRQSGSFKNEFAQFNKQKDFIYWLTPPTDFGPVTVYDVWDLDNVEEHYEKSKDWAETTWKSWNNCHHIISEWVDRFLAQSSGKFLHI